MGGCCSSYIEDFEVQEAKTMTELYNIIKSRTSDQIIMKKEVDAYIANPSYKPKFADINNHSIIELKEHSHFLQNVIDNFNKTCELIHTNRETTLDNDIKEKVIQICQHRMYFSEDVSSILKDVNNLRECLESKKYNI